jgi:2-furoate---CoA ligase
VPEVNAEKIRDGWYYAGVICTLRSDGDTGLSGRVDDIIGSGGENVHPDEVEAVISQHSALADVGVVDFPDDYWGEMVVACVVADVGTSIADLDGWCKDSSLVAYKRPRGYLLVDSMPRSAANTLLRTELRKLGFDDLQRI